MSEVNAMKDSASENFQARFALEISTVDGLPTLPTILWEVQAAIHDQQNGAAEIAQVIEQDPSLTGNILRLANSAYFGSSTRFVSVVDAVTRIGLREIGRLVNATLMIDTFSSMKNTLDYKEFCSHSIQIAEVTGLLADCNPEATSLLTTEAYMLGLLHDVGKLLLDQYFESDFTNSRMYAKEHGCSDAEAELETLGMEHGEIAACLMEVWNLQPSLIEAVRYHHRVTESPDEHKADAEMIRYADELWHVHQRGELQEESLEHTVFKLGESGLEDLVHTLDGAKERAVALLSS